MEAQSAGELLTLISRNFWPTAELDRADLELHTRWLPWRLSRLPKFHRSVRYDRSNFLQDWWGQKGGFVCGGGGIGGGGWGLSYSARVKAGALWLKPIVGAALGLWYDALVILVCPLSMCNTVVCGGGSLEAFIFSSTGSCTWLFLSTA